MENIARFWYWRFYIHFPMGFFFNGTFIYIKSHRVLCSFFFRLPDPRTILEPPLFPPFFRNFTASFAVSARPPFLSFSFCSHPTPILRERNASACNIHCKKRTNFITYLFCILEKIHIKFEMFEKPNGILCTHTQTPIQPISIFISIYTIHTHIEFLAETYWIAMGATDKVTFWKLNR